MVLVNKSSYTNYAPRTLGNLNFFIRMKFSFRPEQPCIKDGVLKKFYLKQQAAIEADR